jgi:hypothetical protein
VRRAKMRHVIDKFVGNPAEFYRLVVEEITERELPDMEFNWHEEKELDQTFFNKGAKANTLRIRCKSELVYVLAFQVGNCFFVSVRNHKFGSAPDTYLYGVMATCFHTTVARCVRKALKRHMEAQNIPIPSFLISPEDSVLEDSAA